MTIAGREAVIEGYHGCFYITSPCRDCGASYYLQRDGEWYCTTGLDRGFWPSREAAQAAIDAHADKPTPPAGNPADGKMVAVGEGAHNTMTAGAIEWLATACYATYLQDPLGRLPHYEELPERCKVKWREVARGWLTALLPLLDGGITGKP